MGVRRSRRPRDAGVAEPVVPRAAPLRALVDSGPFIALFDARDRWHDPVRTWLREHPAIRLVGTWAVLTEVTALLARRVRNEAALDFLRWIDRGAVSLDTPEAGSLREVLRASERFADLPFDLAAASIAEAAERLGIDQVLSIDRDFAVYRDRRGKRLVDLLRDGG